MLAVLAYHFRPMGLGAGGWVGVNVFFVLSGFLITTLLLNERALRGSISLRRFHLRRLLRIQPALVVFVILWVLAAAVFGSQPWFTTVPGFPVAGPHQGISLWTAGKGAFGALGQYGNWVSALGIASQRSPIGHVWSIAVEEQYYLVWPVVLVVVMRVCPRWTLRSSVVLLVGSAALSPLLWLHGSGFDRIYFGTDTAGQALLLGSVAAQLWVSGRLDRLLARGGAMKAALAAGALLGVATLLLGGAERARALGGMTAIDIAAAVVVVAVAAIGRPANTDRPSPEPRWAAALTRPFLVHTGRRSYALYLWSYVFATWFHSMGLPGFVVGTAASFAVAELSWYLVERPALGWKERLSRPSAAPRAQLSRAG